MMHVLIFFFFHIIGGGSLGHPKIYINLDRPGPHPCTYCMYNSLLWILVNYTDNIF